MSEPANEPLTALDERLDDLVKAITLVPDLEEMRAAIELKSAGILRLLPIETGSADVLAPLAVWTALADVIGEVQRLKEM